MSTPGKPSKKRPRSIRSNTKKRNSTNQCGNKFKRPKKKHATLNSDPKFEFEKHSGRNSIKNPTSPQSPSKTNNNRLGNIPTSIGDSYNNASELFTISHYIHQHWKGAMQISNTDVNAKLVKSVKEIIEHLNQSFSQEQTIASQCRMGVENILGNQVSNLTNDSNDNHDSIVDISKNDSSNFTAGKIQNFSQNESMMSQLLNVLKEQSVQLAKLKTLIRNIKKAQKSLFEFANNLQKSSQHSQEENIEFRRNFNIGAQKFFDPIFGAVDGDLAKAVWVPTTPGCRSLPFQRQ